MLRILCLVPLRLWEGRVSASRRHDIQAISRHPKVEFRQSGQGWPDWNERAPAVENVARIMPDCQCVFWYKPDGTRVSGTTIQETPGFRGLADRYLTVEKWQESWWPGPNPPPAWQQAIDRRVKLAIMSHENDLPRMVKAEEAGIVVKHIPHCAEATVFGGACQPWEKRDWDVVLTGTIGTEHYPLRARWQGLVGRLSSELNTPVREHPRPPHLAASLPQAERYVQEYAEILGRSKIVLGCPSKWAYALSRFCEAAASGAVHVSSMPDDSWFAKTLGKHIVTVSKDASDRELIDTVVAAFSDDKRLQKMSEDGHRQWREEFVQERFADRFVAAVESCL